MDAYISVTDGNGEILIVRTSDWQVIARCATQTFANPILAGLNA